MTVISRFSQSWKNTVVAAIVTIIYLSNRKNANLKKIEQFIYLLNLSHYGNGNVHIDML